ncbi:MAG: serine/threonine-protein kinase [Fuerstiella sp.]
MEESEIFEAALHQPAGPERSAFLDEACRGDSDVRRRVQNLLMAHENPDSFLDNPAQKAFSDAPIDETIIAEVEREGKQVGPYKLLQQIGEGGMGVVFMAQQIEPIKRRVALKIIKPGIDTREVIARFEAERQALALMDHPNIAKVLDAGTTAQGRPYFVMELVNGVPLTEYCDQHNLSTTERLKLFAAVCQGVQHAHQKGIIHRDLKPGNVLVADYDDQPVPKVIDFGVAKATNQQLTEKTLFTQLGQIVGTLEYMSPEQAKRNQLDVDTRSDVYSLGIVLYELLTGETPLNRQSLRAAAFDEILRMIREVEPVLPSRKLSDSKQLDSVAAHRCVDAGRLTAIIRGDLDWIVVKTLQKDRSERYVTAQELSDDVTRHLNDLPILAGPPRMMTRVRKFAKRNSWPLLAGTSVLVLLLSAVCWYTHMAGNVQHQVADRSERVSQAIEAASLALGQAMNSPVSSSAEWTVAEAGMQRIRDLISEGEVTIDAKNRAESLIAHGEESHAERDIAVRLENVLIMSASHPDLKSWQRMEEELRQLFADHGFNLDSEDPQVIATKIKTHRFAKRFSDILELWIGTRASMSGMGGPAATREILQPWTDAIYAADDDPLRTGIRRLICIAQPVTEEKLRKLTKDVDLTTRSPRTLTWLASVYGMAGMFDEGNQNVRETLRRHPSDVMLNFDYGFSLYHQKRWHEAARMYSQAIALRPDAAGIWQMLGMALEKADELDNARDAFRRACELEHDYGPTWANLGNVLLRQEDGDQALTAGRRVIELMPDHPRGYAIAGRALMQQEKFNEALPLLEKCDEVRVNHRRWQKTSKRWIAECRQKLKSTTQPDKGASNDKS